MKTGKYRLGEERAKPVPGTRLVCIRNIPGLFAEHVRLVHGMCRRVIKKRADVSQKHEGVYLKDKDLFLKDKSVFQLQQH